MNAPREERRKGRRPSFFGAILDALQPAIDQVPVLSSAVAIARAEGVKFFDDLRSRRRARLARARRTRQRALELPDAVVAQARPRSARDSAGSTRRIFETKVVGRAQVPQHVNFLVAANHASHLDMGLVKHALGDQGENLVALAARDYFFSSRLKRTISRTSPT